MDSLQDELIMDILSRVPTLDLLKLSFVCRRWRNIVNDPLFRRVHSTRSLSNPSENQVLVLKRGSELYLVDLADKSSPRQVAIGLPPIRDFEHFYHIIGSCNGLLCLASTSCLSILVTNPCTRQHVHLSAYLNSKLYAIRSWGFGFDEITKLFKVVVFVSSVFTMHRDLEVRVCDLGGADSMNWRSLGASTFFMNPDSSCFVNGRLHWTYMKDDSHYGILSFDLADEKFRPIPTPHYLQLQGFFLSSFHLIVLGGCLCIFYSQRDATPNLQIWVMKEYGNEASWVKELDTCPVIPESLNSPLERRRRIRVLKGLGFGKDCELVMSAFNTRTHAEDILVSSDSTCNEFKHLQLERPPYKRESIIHAASLNWI